MGATAMDMLTEMEVLRCTGGTEATNTGRSTATVVWTCTARIGATAVDTLILTDQDRYTANNRTLIAIPLSARRGHERGAPKPRPENSTGMSRAVLKFARRALLIERVMQRWRARQDWCWRAWSDKRPARLAGLAVACEL